LPRQLGELGRPERGRMPQPDAGVGERRLCCSLRSANGEALFHDPAREAAAGVVVGEGKHSASVALAHVSPGEHPENFLWELEQTQAVGDGRFRASDAIRDIAERQLELVDERGVGSCLFDRRELLARDVLDQPEQ